MITHVAAEIFCNNYYLCKLKPLALSELIRQLEKLGWLRCPAAFFLLFKLHDCHLKIKWDRHRLLELVYLLDTLLSKKIIMVSGNRGFWSAIEKHLVDFEYKPIKTSLSDVCAKYKENKSMYSLRTREVDKILIDVMHIQSSGE